MTAGVDVVRIHELDEDVVELGRNAFGHPRDRYRAYLEWKYLRNPYQPEPLLYVARDPSGRAVAMRGFYGARWSTPAGVVDIPCADEFAVAEARRASGIAGELMRGALADLSARGVTGVVNASGGRIAVLQSLALGWKSVLAVDPLDRSLARSRLGETFQRVRKRVRPRPRSLAFLDGADDVVPAPDADELATLAGGVSEDEGIRHVRDAAFFRWRYANPQRDYRFLVAGSEGRLTGWLAIGLQQPRPTTLPLYLADWEGESPAVRGALLERAVELCGSATLRVWAASVSAETRSQLRSLGFEPGQPELRAQGMPCVLFRALDPQSETLGSSSWDVRLIDSMHG